MSTAILKNALSGETIAVRQAKGRVKRGRRVFNVWIDGNGMPVCVIGNEQPTWEVLVLNRNVVENDEKKVPGYEIGQISR